MPAAIIIPKIILAPFLGVSENEQKTSQVVEVYLKISLEREPLGCHSDQIEDTFCYHKFRDEVVSMCSSRAFHLIEHLAFEISKIAKRLLCEKNLMFQGNLTLRKIQVPITEYPEGVIFSLDF